ncbi:MAG: acyltransferase [Ruminococcus sp.]|nr:acyltransferase [Ruminococcus sp.]
MKAKRLWHTVRLAFTRGGSKRARYVKQNEIFDNIGNNVMIQGRILPLYSELIRFHNNIVVARNVDFVTHDVMHTVFNRVEGSGGKYSEMIGCIEIMDNVFIGSNSVILYNTKIGPNVVIASGSVVTKDCEPNSVYAGVPAKRIGSFDDLMKKRKQEQDSGQIAVTHHNQLLTKQEKDKAWEIFKKKHCK